MKKLLCILIFLFCVLAFACSSAIADIETTNPLKPLGKEGIVEARLPDSVTIIKDEAFEGTGLIKVELSDNVSFVGERAFANISSLREIRIPLATHYIASTAFEGSNRITIIAPANSYARMWAKNQGLPFSPLIMLYAFTQTNVISIIFVDRFDEIIELDCFTTFKSEAQWRKLEETNITQIEELIANHVQGRSPPIA